MTMPTAMTGERSLGQSRGDDDIHFLQYLFSFQETHRCFFMIADYQAFATQAFDPAKTEERTRSLVYDYLAAGFDPGRSFCFMQSQVPQLFDLAAILSNLVTVRALHENLGLAEDLGGEFEDAPFGFVGYPVSQAADILLFRAEAVPTGADQHYLVDLSREMAIRFNNEFGEVFLEPEGYYYRKEDTLGGNETAFDEAAFRKRRAELEAEALEISGILHAGGSAARVEGQRTLEKVKDAIGTPCAELV